MISLYKCLLILGLLLGLHPAQAVIAFRSASSASVRAYNGSVTGTGSAAYAASGNLSPGPSVTADRNSLLVCVVEQHDNVAISFPAGWNQLYSISPSTTQRASLYYKVSGQSESSPVITHSGGNAIIAQCTTVRGVDAYNPWDIVYAAQYAANSSTVASGALTTLLANDFMLFAMHMAGNPSTQQAQTPSGNGNLSWSQRMYGSTSSGSAAGLALYSGTKTSAGAIGPISAIISSPMQNEGILIPMRSGNSLSIPVPAGTQVGDVMIAAISAVSQSVSISTPTGWNVATPVLGSNSRLVTYYRVATSSEPAFYSWLLTPSHTGAAGGIVSFSGVNTSSPIDAKLAQATTSALTHSAPSITTTQTTDMLVTVHEFASAPYSSSSPYTGAWSPPSGMTEAVDERSRATSSGSGVALEINYQQLSASGLTTNKTATAYASADAGATASIALKAIAGLDHLQIDYPQDTLSSCTSTPVTVSACASSGTSCSSLYTGGVSGITLTPSGGSINIPAGSGSVSATVTQAAGAGTLGASASAPNAATCKNLSTGIFGCGVTFSATLLTIAIPNFVSGTTVSATANACTLPNGLNTVSFYTSYVDPSSGSLPLGIAQKQSNGSCGAYTNVSSNSAAPTPIALSFNTNASTLCFSYPDSGKVKLVSTIGSATASTFFTTVPDHFVISSVSCVSGSSGCKSTPNPAASSATGSAFVKAGTPFLLTVKAYNGASPAGITPNFGKESNAEQVVLTPQSNMADLVAAVTGKLVCTTPSSSCANGANGVVVLGGFGAVNGGEASNSLSYDEVGIITLTPSLYDPNGLGYLSVGSAAMDPSGYTSGNIGRFIPDHFAIQKDLVSPVITQSDFLPQVTANAVATIAPATTIAVDNTSGFAVGAKVRLTGGGGSNNAMTATVTGLNGSSLTLDTAISSDLAGDEIFVQEWGSYMGESFAAQFSLLAQNANNQSTSNYQGAYAYLNPAGAGNPLGFAALSGATNLSSRLVASAAVTGTFGGTGSSTVVAPLTINRAVSADGPFTAVMLGIAPMDADGIVMGGGSPYDISVAGGLADHTSIMDPATQSSITVRYGRSKISNAYGSEMLPLMVPIALQYWNGTTYVTATDDANTRLSASNVSLNSTLGSLTSAFGTSATGTCQPTPLPSALTLTNGAGKFCLLKPGVSGTVTLSANAPSYLLPGISGIAKFGVYKSPLIYRRENY